ncbi:hypothetical protein BO70DRAFT_119153 [Aspergillus heteromorphus CBS 117.55]|uniref:Uncharacterized protein n=1 Tax=Aspergillus heteromorphus CBS 117.55 TaxID=1448321 RepID=A0A317VFG3_9EURO|nr:uncharacterized protein BO70DRAFT_119153 [Aspergillus heteromorphus CBS 117.55]PWY71612.1 hypothetical protein BO70DRAFT_119153 [Aspergillus heteromorphus CBS 117.55]
MHQSVLSSSTDSLERVIDLPGSLPFCRKHALGHSLSAGTPVGWAVPKWPVTCKRSGREETNFEASRLRRLSVCLAERIIRVSPAQFVQPPRAGGQPERSSQRGADLIINIGETYSIMSALLLPPPIVTVDISFRLLFLQADPSARCWSGACAMNVRGVYLLLICLHSETAIRAPVVHCPRQVES